MKCEQCDKSLDGCRCPDPPMEEVETWYDLYWYAINRAAENVARWLRAVGLIGVCLWIPHAHAQAIQEGYFCDTSNEVQAILQMDNPQEALAQINASIPDACGYAPVKFWRGKTLKYITSGLKTYAIAPIWVLAQKGRYGWMSWPMENHVQWSAFSTNLIDVTWVHTAKDDPAVVAWFERQEIMPKARARIELQYGMGWIMCCNNTERVRVHFAVKDGQYWGVPLDGGKPFLLPADTIHPYDPTMPAQLAVEGVVMVVEPGHWDIPVPVVTCVWLPQVGG